MATKLGEFLHDKRYLIVVDDLWTVSAWDAIQSRLPSSTNGSRIIVTTRIDSVAKECSDPTVGTYHIQKLNLTDSRKLFMCKAFGSAEASCPDELEITMKKILKKCGGLPLAIISIASLLASYSSPESKDMWERICKSIGSQMDISPTLEGMRQIISLSYNHLPYNLKGCMMYLSIFPEDHEIKTIWLLYKWIAEGLVEEKRGLTLMEVAESYFDELISRCMIVPTSSMGYNGKAEACRVHDMMLEVMVSKSLEANFVSLVGAQYEGVSYDRIRRLSIHDAPMEDSSSKKKSVPLFQKKKKKEEGHIKSYGFERMNMKHVRSLTMFEIEGQQNLLGRLREFTLLRVLDLDGCNGLENKHVEDICGMYLLRFLSLRCTNVSVLPKKIGELEHLQMLNVDQTSILELPEEVTMLQRLEHVDFRNKGDWRIMWTPPHGLSKMKALREVNYMVVNDVDVAREVGELGQLRRIGIWIWIDDIDEDVLRELGCSLSKNYSLRSLTIGGFQEGTLNFLIGMDSPPRLLRYLSIDGDTLPNWVGSLAYLTEFDIMNSFLVDDQPFAILCNLPNLQKIWLGPEAYVGQELVARTSHNFPVLREFVCYFVGAYKFEKGAMDTLKVIEVKFGAYESSLVRVEHLPNLEEVIVSIEEGYPSRGDELDKLMAESKARPDHRQFKIVVKYEE